MLNIIKLFGRTPFAPLQSHMDKVSEAVLMLPSLFDAIEQEDYGSVREISKQISKVEHTADLIKNDIRNHLPKSLFLSIDRSALLEILSLQDAIADTAEDIAVLVSLRELKVLDLFREDYRALLDKSIQVFERLRDVIRELDELMESSFGGIEADKVRGMVEEIDKQEHESDLIQRRLLRALFNADDQFNFIEFYMWQKTFQGIADLANISEKLGHRVRATLECG